MEIEDKERDGVGSGEKMSYGGGLGGEKRID